ncbi:integrase catalytic domain-containing protein [Trichonephila clavipes]|nr:integrase catalytic domain-containing protein [Trichonephila clavipes]
MPLKEDPSCLGESRQTAIQRLNSLWKRLSRDKEYLSLYEKFLQEYEDLGHMREIKADGSEFHFTCHTMVFIAPKKSTTKLRTVFNASSPSTSRKSLNSIQFNGGLFQEDLFSIMVLFRKHKYAFYYGYRENVSHDKHTSGASVFAKNSVEERHRRANKNVRVNYSHLRHKYAFLESDETKALGIIWNPKLDCFLFQNRATKANPSFTKRMVLSTIARIFDPLGLLGPIKTWAKIFMQRLWLLELGWSDELPFKEERSGVDLSTL